MNGNANKYHGQRRSQVAQRTRHVDREKEPEPCPGTALGRLIRLADLREDRRVEAGPAIGDGNLQHRFTRRRRHSAAPALHDPRERGEGSHPGVIAALKQTSQAAQTLDALAESLRDSVSRFKA